VDEITTFDLLKSALRQRPDIIIVGEVRGEEVYTLFQSIASNECPDPDKTSKDR
jgi:flagellar protein FlaI